MMLTRIGTTLGAGVTAIALLTASASIWLVLADPGSLVDAVNKGGPAGLVEAVARLIVRALEHIVRWL